VLYNSELLLNRAWVTQFRSWTDKRCSSTVCIQSYVCH